MSSIIKPLIIKDTREQTGWSFGEDDFFAGMKIEKLNVGDYSLDKLSHLIFIERKANTGELSSNFIAPRFKKLLLKSQYYKYRYIIIECDYEDILQFPLNSNIPRWQHKKMRITSQFLNSYITKLTLDGFNVIFAGNSKNAEKFCYNLLKQIYKRETNVS